MKQTICLEIAFLITSNSFAVFMSVTIIKCFINDCSDGYHKIKVKPNLLVAWHMSVATRNENMNIVLLCT